MHVTLFRHQHTSQQSALYSRGSALQFWMKEWVLTMVIYGCFTHWGKRWDITVKRSDYSFHQQPSKFVIQNNPATWNM